MDLPRNKADVAKHWHVPSLDGVRGVALLIVMFAHTAPQVFPGGNIGVDLFFVLSGFLITTILLAEFSKTGSISICSFYMKRALRLLPALFLMVALVIAYAALFTPVELPAALGDVPSVVFYFYNWHRVAAWGKTDLFFGFGHLWSLSVEEQFYILWPLLLLVTLRSRLLFGLVLAVGITAPACARVLLWEEGPALQLYFRTDLRLDSLMWGATAAWLNLRWNFPRSLSAIPLFALIFFVVLARYNLLSSGVLYLGGYSVVCFLASIVLIATAQNLSPWLTRILEFSPLCFTGRISYGLYLWHVPVFGMLPHSHSVLANATAIALTFAIATCSYYGVEKWFLSRKERWSINAGAVGANAMPQQ
ncbi:acyltransferase family protein [Mesorhizobium amorphae]|uniref:acyltransferase family protein n=1 Tax=Mesorhizobium amorphae TaxID=71433 RepID=UPI001186F8D4|nr:acyltransferase [Mesorhizobium amorphae]